MVPRRCSAKSHSILQDLTCYTLSVLVTSVCTTFDAFTIYFSYERIDPPLCT